MISQNPSNQNSYLLGISSFHKFQAIVINSSTVLNEINQRRKLAKELDRHALCEAILQTSEKAGEREPKNLIAKVDLFSPDGKIVYSARKTFGFRDSAFEALRLEKFQECPYSNGDLLRQGRQACRDVIFPDLTQSSYDAERKSTSEA